MATDELETGAAALLVDDEEMVAGFLYALLSARGFEVEIAESGSAALNRLAGREFDLVVADRGLPDMSVVDLAAQSLALVPSLRFVVLASMGSTRAALEVFRAGAADYLVRGEGDVESFVRQLREVLAAPPPERHGFSSLDEASLPDDFRAAMTLLRERARGILASQD